MTKFYAYTRVSTLKQGEKGVSLQEQHAAIALYAERHGLQITEWFEEVLTAAKKGRPLFTRMLKGLQRGEAHGVIIHKIDRSARNLRDWADLGELIDAGVAVHFANESLDMLSRGGRLSADIQAVVAADYVRNLREETRKGLYGRLKQGVYPFQAPLGYLDTGSGRLKEIDSARGPLIRHAFEAYATGRYTLDTLLPELHRLGLRNRRSGPVSRNSLSLTLNNPFYTGLIRIKRNGQTFAGNHVALVSMSLFKQVKARLDQRIRMRQLVHDFTFRGLFHCTLCGRQLTGEIQKGNVYYRCHTPSCPTQSFREERLEAALLKSFPPIALTDESKEILRERLERVERSDAHSETDRRNNRQAELGAVKARLSKLIDVFVDGALDKHSFEERKRGLLEEQQSIEESLQDRGPDIGKITRFVMDRFELACSAQQSYRLADSAARRELAIRLCSNRTVAGKHVSVEPYFPLHLLAQRALISNGGHHRYTLRTVTNAAEELWKWGLDELKKVESLP